MNVFDEVDRHRTLLIQQAMERVMVDCDQIFGPVLGAMMLTAEPEKQQFYSDLFNSKEAKVEITSLYEIPVDDDQVVMAKIEKFLRKRILTILDEFVEVVVEQQIRQTSRTIDELLKMPHWQEALGVVSDTTFEWLSTLFKENGYRAPTRPAKQEEAPCLQ